MAPRRSPPPLGTLAAYAAFAGAWVGLLLWENGVAAFGFFLASRLAYVGFAGFSLRAQDASEWYTRRWGEEGGFRRYRTVVSVLMNNDAVAMGLAMWLTRGTLVPGLPDAVVWALGGVLVAGGIGMKSWAASTLGLGAYYWRSFFIPPAATKYVVSGPYRWFENPMYTVGYLHAYGLALLLHSAPGLLAALLAQGLMLGLNHWAEKPHTDRMRLRAGAASAGD